MAGGEPDGADDGERACVLTAKAQAPHTSLSPQTRLEFFIKFGVRITWMCCVVTGDGKGLCHRLQSLLTNSFKELTYRKMFRRNYTRTLRMHMYDGTPDTQKITFLSMSVLLGTKSLYSSLLPSFTFACFFPN